MGFFCSSTGAEQAKTPTAIIVIHVFFIVRV
jgi:hypothetical protein